MAGVIYGGSTAYSALISNPVAESVMDYVEEHNHLSLSRLSDIGRNFRDRIRGFRERSGFEEVSRIRERATRMMKSLFKEDDIRQLISLEDFQTSRRRMRRWTFADPELRQMYRDKRLSGWDRSIEDIASIKPEEHPDYLYVINGMEKDGLCVTHIDEFIDIVHDTEELSLFDKVEIMQTWENAKRIIVEQKYDPTSLWGAMVE